MKQNKGTGGRARKFFGGARQTFRKRGGGEKARLLLLIFLCIYGAAALALPMERILRRPSSLVVTDMRGAPLRGTLSSRANGCSPCPLSEMGRWMPAAAVAIEDRRFYAHRGMDWLSVARAARQNMDGGARRLWSLDDNEPSRPPCSAARAHDPKQAARIHTGRGA